MSELRAALYYMGSKARLVQTFRTIFHESWPDAKEMVFVDAFAGTGVVTLYAGSLFGRCIVNDQERYSTLVLKAQFARPAHLEPWPAQPASIAGFITDHYCPRKKDSFSRHDRLFWSRENGMLLDGFRNWAIATLQGAELEYAMGCMLIAADRCSNTTGGYWAFLRHFRGSQGRRKVAIQQLPASGLDVDVRSEDATALCLGAPKNAILYLDPPYGRRQYGNNYFVLNMIGSVSDALIENDRGRPGGTTGMPIDRNFNKSVWCTRDALAELRTILKGTPASRMALSYSNDPKNVMSIEDIQSSFKDCGWACETYELDHTRYASQNPSALGSALTELLFVANRTI